jgi:polyisoprenoid-binding protein YceI
VRSIRLLPSGTVLVGWLIVSGAAPLACELPARPGTENHLRFRLDPHESGVRFDADARLHTFAGTAGKLSGQVRLARASPPDEASACLEIDAATLTTGIDLRDERMRKKHLETDRFPIILFTLSGLGRIEPVSGDRYSVILDGTLMLHGVSRPLTAQAIAHLSSTSFEVEGKVPLRLSAFQIPIPSFLFISMEDEVVVSFKVKAVRE